MSTHNYSKGDGTYLRLLNNVKQTGAADFEGLVGTIGQAGAALEVSTGNPVTMTDGECTVPFTSTVTRIVGKKADGSLFLSIAP
jgi:hypothetical protein